MVIGKHYGCCTLPAAAPSRSPRTPAATWKALLVTAPSRCAPSCAAGPGCNKPGACAALQAAASDQVEYRATIRALRVTAQRILQARQQAKELE